MRLGYTITSYPPAVGGAQLHAHMLAQHLGSEFEVRVASLWSRHRTDWLRGTTLSGPLRSREYEIDGVRVTRIGLSRRERLGLAPSVLGYPIWQRYAVRRIAETLLPRLRESLPQARLIHNFRIGREPLTQASAMLALEMGVPFVLTPFHHPRWSSWLFRVYHDLYRSADAVLALTEAERRVLVGLGVPAERISVVGHGAVLAAQPRAEQFEARFGPGQPIVLFLGQKFPYKGLADLLEAAPLVWRRYPSTRFVFMGPRTHASARLFDRVRDSRILEVDTVSLQDKTDALAACTMLCVPSAQESFGGVYVEAWSLGKPVIAADTPATRELIDHGEDGLLVSQESRGIAEAIERLLDDPTMASQLGSRGKEKVAERYRWSMIAKRVSQTYHAVLSRHRTVAEV